MLYEIQEEIPLFLQEAAASRQMQRLKNVGMNCGCEYTSLPGFCTIACYSRFEHSLNTARFVWHFTHNEKMSLAALFHDIATPVFAHVIDFMHGDALKQETTEKGTAEIIADSREIQTLLHRDGISTNEVSNYHLYPVADNDSPKLSADRLEYTLGNMINYGFSDADTAVSILDDLIVGRNEEGEDEIMFSHAEKAQVFAQAMLQCSKVYVSDEDRCAMETLARLLKKAIEAGIVTEKDLYQDEQHVISLLCTDSYWKGQWQAYCSINEVLVSEDKQGDDWFKVIAKKRRIDPYILHEGRLSKIDQNFQNQMDQYLKTSQDVWLKGIHHGK